MEFLLENILNLIGFIIGIIIGVFAYVGYKNTGSPVLFRLTIAFMAIGIGFGIIWMGYVTVSYTHLTLPTIYAV